MEILLLLIPLSAVLLGFAAWAFIWSVNHRQFDNLDQHALHIFDDDQLNPGTFENHSREDQNE